MAVCQYAGETGCSAPVFGGGSTPVYTTAAPHVNFLEQHLFGTSPIEWVLNSLLIALIIRFIIWPFVIVPLLDWLDFRRQRHVKTVLLELTPPHSSVNSPKATTEFFTKLHSLYSLQSYEDHLLRHKQLFTCEVPSSREEGIRFIARVPASSATTFQNKVISLLPEVKFKEVDDYLARASEAGNLTELMEFRQFRSFIHPLRVQDLLATYDPITDLTGAIAKPKSGELFVWQFTIAPYNSRRIMRIYNKLKEGKNPWLLEFNAALPLNVLLVTLKCLAYTFVFLYNGAVFIIGLFSGNMPTPSANSGSDTAAPLSAADQAMQGRMISKMAEPLFYVDIRALVVTDDPEQAEVRMDGITSSLASFNEPGYQQLIPGDTVLPPLVRRLLDAIAPESVKQRYEQYRESKLRLRLPSMFTYNSNKLSVSELASLYHFPYGDKTHTENTVQSLSKTLPAPAVIKKRSDNADFAVILGLNKHHGSETNIGLITKEREKHLYIIGGTGNGKTTMMQYAIVQDIRNGKGVAVVDPHGDMAKTILKYIPRERIKDVIYMNPIDIKHPIGLNLLELPDVVDEDDLLLEKGRVTSSVVSVMRKVFSDDDSNAHRIEAIMRNAIHTALTVEGATLFTVLKLLRNAKFRKEVVAKLDDEHLKDFWREEIGQAGDMQLVSMTKGVTQRIDRFNSSEPAKRMLGQSKSTINFEDIMDSGKILICDLGDIEEDESELFGTTILAKLKMAAERRVRMPEHERKPFYVYVDEFQNFATTPFVKMLSSSRKFKMFLTIAEQSTKQQEEDRLTQAILSNVSTVVCFRTGSHDDEELLLHRFEPFIDKGAISNLPTYNFYIRIQAMESLEPMSGITIVLAEEEAREDISAKVVEASRDTYAITYVKPVETDQPKSEQDQGNNDPDDKDNKGAEQKDNDKNQNSNDALSANDDE
jgi:hypothetical protein